MKTLLLVIAIAIAATAHGQTYRISTIYTFPQLEDGSADSPGSLTIDSSGNMFTNACCSSVDFGSIIKISSAGVVTTLYTFTGGPDGGDPGNLTRDSGGNLYGATGIGGAHGSGTIFKLTPSLKETTLYSFNNVHPLGQLLRDSAGNLYGYVSVATGAHQRMFKLTPNGVYSTIHTFCSQASCSDGSNPVGSPIVDKAGNFYGMTKTGGAFGFGTIFKLTPQFKYSVLHSFTGGADGANPTGKLTQHSAGLMYGTAFDGGELGLQGNCQANVPYGCGTVFQITAAGTFTVLYSFNDNGTDGFNPLGAVTLDSAGNIFGVTDDTSTGPDYFPTTFRISTQGVFTALPSASAGKSLDLSSTSRETFSGLRGITSSMGYRSFTN